MKAFYFEIVLENRCGPVLTRTVDRHSQVCHMYTEYYRLHKGKVGTSNRLRLYQKFVSGEKHILADYFYDPKLVVNLDGVTCDMHEALTALVKTL